ncbi:MAG TPA: GNAT family N-acetyltransferase [Sumerlaeia bacterium]|nr:GNAT family N-acetyltransferase [Sumerlaeia bacterium]
MSRQPRKPALSSREGRRLTGGEADARIDELRTTAVSPRSTPENLDRPLDPDIRVTRHDGGSKLELLLDEGDEGPKPVSWAHVCDFRQQIGCATVRMGGIAGVGTHDEYRFRGLSRRVLENALRWMRREGYQTSMLYGIPCFYPKFGYATAFPDVKFAIAVRDAERVEPAGFRFVDFGPDYLNAVLRLYRKSNAGRTGPTLRDAKTWRPFRKGLHWRTKAACRVALDKRGRAAGYFVRHEEHLTAKFLEVGVASPAVFPGILREMARIALDQRLEKIELFLPEDDAFARFCQPLGCTKEMRFRGDGEAMVRLIHVGGAIENAAHELARRMRRPGRLSIRTNLDAVGLTWGRGRLSAGPPGRGGPSVRMPQWALAQMLYGCRDAASLASSGVFRASPQALGMLKEMFPVRPHFHYAVDHF